MNELVIACLLAVTPAAHLEQHMETVSHLQEFDVIELRRYTIRAGERENFARYFETFFPEAFQQLGAIAFGEGFERAKTDHFTWLRGFRDMPARKDVNTAFYYGPLWREHRNTLNGLMLDSDNVLLLKPATADYRIPVLPAVDPVRETSGATGHIVMQIFKPAGDVDAFIQKTESAAAAYRDIGLRDAGLLVSLDGPNNFPQLPVREDGPCVVWLGVVRDDDMLRTFEIVAHRVQQKFMTDNLLVEDAELVVLDPAPRSRLRWLENKEGTQ